MEQTREQTIQEVIDYIDKRFNINPFEGTWVMLNGERIHSDVGYAYEWWRECMKPELEKLKEGDKDA